jgi:hypothetical protein
MKSFEGSRNPAVDDPRDRQARDTTRLAERHSSRPNGKNPFVRARHNAAEEWDVASYETITMEFGIKSGVELVFFLLRRS